jgi:hypothetical protein
MSWVRVGDRILNSFAIVEIFDDGIHDVRSGKERVIRIRLSNNETITESGANADAILAILNADLVVWADKHNPPDIPTKTL